jgi:type IV pilus assembly protein PilN
MNPQGTGINLASQPFGRERAEIAALAAACSVLALSLLVFVTLFLHERRQASTLRRTIRTEQKQLNTLDRQQNQFQNIIARPANADVFSKSVFYNELIARRAVSWTRVFDDLERVMPPNVQLVSLRLPQVIASSEGDRSHLELDMFVGAQQPQAIVGLLKNLQASSLFGPAAVSSQTPPSQNDPLFRFRLSVPYVQKF